MKLFAPLYDWTLRMAAHKHAPRYLGGLSFAESSFFPIPPDVMLAPMCLAKPKAAWSYALVTTITSVLGGMLGYLIGYFALEAIEPWIYQTSYGAPYDRAQEWFEHWGVWVVFLAGFTPIPYKVFTISAGALSMSFLPFVLASFVGRGARFFLVAGLIKWLGPTVEPKLRHYIEVIGWSAAGLIIILAILWEYLH
ncbi:MAG: YqaA family protein [Gammaproteobacteria bacterium]|nr:YqaA family protein [Gammaproteobacteria bacterium]